MLCYRCFIGFVILLAAAETVMPGAADAPPPGRILPVELAGISVVPHVRARSLRYRSEPNNELGARVQLFLRNTNAPATGTNGAFFSNAVLFDEKEPQHFILAGDWAWHDTPNIWPEEDTCVPPGALVVWTFNTKTTAWGLGKNFNLDITDWQNISRATVPSAITPPAIWLSAVTFLSTDAQVYPNRLIFHVANQSGRPVKITGARLYLPETNKKRRWLYPQPWLTNLQLFPAGGMIPNADKGCACVETKRLPLTYAALEVSAVADPGKPLSLWAHLRIKRESFDIGGGWVNDGVTNFSPVTSEPFLKTLRRMHVNTANLVSVPGYTDQTGPSGLYARFPLKRFGKLEPPEMYDTDAMLPYIHALEFLGEPQYEGGGIPRFPQAVCLALQPYAQTRLATTVTLSDESTWRFYAGLSDYPNLQTPRVAAPAADDWLAYDRWEEKAIGWGAPLETLGDLCRSLRELSRPAPIAAWVQGPQFNSGIRDGRKRASPTPDEIRLQAYHALSSRITSLYWHNLSLRALVQYRDTMEGIMRIGREIKMLEDLYLEGDAYGYHQTQREGKPDWDLAAIVSSKGALLFALDLDYSADRSDKVFQFKRPRDTSFNYDLPAYLRRPVEVFRVDADGIFDVKYILTARGIEITDKQNKVALYVAAAKAGLRAQIESRRLALFNYEQFLEFDPANRGRDFDVLKAMVR